jgi:hypothetical protein
VPEQNALLQIPREQYFYLHNGRSISSIEDFKNYLNTINDDTVPEFMFHTYSNGNNFANWIRFVFKMPELADKIAKIHDQKIMLQLISEYEEKYSTDNKPALNASNASQNLSENMQTVQTVQTVQTNQTLQPLQTAQTIQPVQAQISAESTKTIDTETKDMGTINSADEEEKDDNSIVEFKEQKIDGYEPDSIRTNITGFSQKSDAMTDHVKKLKDKGYFNKKDYQETTTDIEEEYETLKMRISENRRKGKDMFIPDLKLRNIKPKIQYYLASQRPRDFDTIIALLDDIRLEIKDAEEQPEVDLKKEVLQASGQYKHNAEE